MKKKMPITTLVLAATLLAASVPAIAGDSAKLRYNSTELSTSFQASRLYQRIERVAGNYCTVPGRRALARMVAEQRCVTEVLDRMIRKIDSGLLTAIHDDQRLGRKLASR